MASKMKKKEIEEFIKSKSTTQDTYIAPTVRTHVDTKAPAMAQVAQTVKPTIGQTAGYIGKAAKTGLVGGVTSVPTSNLQEIEGGLKKGKNIKNAGDVAKQIVNSLSTISNITNPLSLQNVLNVANNMSKSTKKALKDKNKDALSKALSIGTAAVSNAADMANPTRQLAESVFPLVGAVDKKSDQKVRNLINTINKPNEKLQQELAEESQNHGKVANMVASGVQAATNMIPSLAATAITRNPNIGMAVMANNVKGQATEEALKQGKSLEEAREIGNVRAAAEVATEMLSGGLANIYGKGATDDVAKNIIDRYIQNPTANFLATKASGIVGENVEESLSNVLNKAIDKGTVDPNAKITMNDITEPWGPTTISTLLLNGATGDYSRASFNQNAAQLQAQSPITKVQNMNDVERNALTEITMKRKQGIPLDENDMATINYLNNRDNVVTDQNVPLNQNVQQTQENNFVYEPTDNVKINNFRQSASQFMNNSQQTQDFVKTVEKVINDKNYNITFDNTIGDDVNGRIRMNNGEVEIKINPNSERAGEFILTHEITHGIETKEMSNLIMDYASKNSEFNNALQSLKESYGTEDITPEVVADISGQMFGDEAFITNLSTTKPNVFKTIYDKIISLANKITGNSNEALFIKDLKNKWEKAYREANIETARENLGNETRLSKEQSNNNNFKKQQNEIIQKSNPRDKDLGEHTWINSVEDIKTYQEALNSDEYENGNLTPDMTEDMVSKALETGKMTVYSSYPIEQGTFVTPSKMEAQNYAGDGKVYSKEISLNDVAWIDSLQGQYAKVEENNNTQKNISTQDNEGRKLSKEQQDFFKDVAPEVRDENGNLKTVYHTTTDEVAQFNEFNPVGTRYYRFGDQVVNYYTDSKDMSGSYASQDYKMADTKKINNMADAEEYLKQISDITGNEYNISKHNTMWGVTQDKQISKEARQFIDTLTENEKQQMLDNIWEEPDDSPLKDSNYDRVFSWNNFDKDLQKKYNSLTEKYLGTADTVAIQQEVMKYLESPVLLSEDNRLNGEVVGIYETEDELLRNLKSDLQKQDWSKNSKLQYEGYVNITNPYVVDAEKRNWNQVIQQSNDFIDDLEERVPQETKDNLTRLYNESANKSNEARDNYEVLEPVIRQGLDGYLSSVDEDIRKVNNVVKKVGFQELNDYLDNDVSPGVNFWYNIAEELENQGLIGQATKSFIIEDFKLPEQVKNLIKENYTKKIPIQQIQSDNIGKVAKQVGNEPTLRELYEKNYENYQEFDKYRMPSHYFLEQLENGNADIGYELDDMLETRGQIMGTDVVAEEIAQAASVGFSKPELIRIWGTSKTTNDIVKEIIASNKDGKTNYDGVIIKNVYDYGGRSATGTKANDLFITFNSNQFKAVDNTNPTEDSDIRYSKENKQWREYLEKNFKNEGKKTYFEDARMPLAEVGKEKGTIASSFNNEVKKSSRFKNLTKADETRLNEIFDIQRRGGELSQSQVEELQYLERKEKGLKFPELTKSDQVNKADYAKYYAKANMNNFDSTMLNKAKDIVQPNKQGRRTKQQWLDVAENIGNQASNMDAESLKRYAYESFKEAKPNQAENLNRQGEKYVKFGIQEWINSVYEGAGVGKKLAEKTNLSSIKEDSSYLTIDNEGNAKMSNEVPKVLDKSPTRESDIHLSDVLDASMQRLVNKGHNVDKVAKQTGNNRIRTSYDRVLAVGQEGQNQIGKSQTNLLGKEYKNFKVKNKDGKIENKSLSVNGIYEDAEASGVPSNVLDEYAVNKLNLDRRASNNESWIEQFPNMTEEYSQNVIDDIERLYPEIKRVHGNLTQYYKNLRNNMEYSGILSKDSQEYYDMNTPNYVRIQRVGGRNGSASSTQSRSGVKVNNQQQKIKGGNMDILPIRDTTAQFTLDTLSSMRKNIVAKELAKVIAPESSLENTMIEFGDNKQFNGEIAIKNKNGEYQLTYFENGEAKTIPIDSGIYYAMTNPEISKGTKLIEQVNQKYGAGLVSRAQRGLLTDKNAYFILTNFFKDIGDAPLNSKYTKSFVKNYPSMWVDLAKGGPYSTLWKNSGGEASSYFKDGRFVGESTATNIVGKAIEKVGKGIDKALTPIEIGNNFIEQLPRLTEFKSTIEANGYEVTADGDIVPQKGKNPTKSVDEVLDEAMYNSSEITTNFKRGGTWTKAANRNGATFLNASVQGFDKFIRNFTDVIDTTTGKPKINSKAAVKLMLKATLFGIAPSMINDIMNGDDDDYEDIPEYQKDSYYLFKLDNHKWLRIPKGRMTSIFGSAARRTKNLAKGDTKAFDGFIQQTQNQVAPNNPFTDNAFAGFFAVKNNKSWSGNPIVSTWEENPEHPEDEYDSKTDEFSKWLGKKLHKSPKKINYVLDQYSGIIGDILLPLNTKYTNTPMDNKAAQSFLAPLQNKFTTNDIMSNKSQSEFYDAYTKAQNEVSHNKKNNLEKPEDNAVKSYLTNRNKEMSEIKSEIEKVQSSNMTNKEKIAKVQEYQDQINTIAKDALKDVVDAKENKYYMQIGDYYYKRVVRDGKDTYERDTSKNIPTEKYALYDYYKEKYEKSKR